MTPVDWIVLGIIHLMGWVAWTAMRLDVGKRGGCGRPAQVRRKARLRLKGMLLGPVWPLGLVMLFLQLLCEQSGTVLGALRDDWREAELLVPRLPRRLRGNYQDPQEGQLSLPPGEEKR